MSSVSTTQSMLLGCDMTEIEHIIARAMNSKRYHWTPKRKAALIKAVKDGRVSNRELRALGFTYEELSIEAKRLEEFGVNGLRATRIGFYRSKENIPTMVGV